MSADDEIDAEFEEMKLNYENFIKHLPQVQNIKENVFYHIVDSQKTKSKLVKMARDTRPFLAKEIWDLLDDYMNFLSNLPGIEGNNYKIVYENFSKADLVKRMLFKRPIKFVGVSDCIVMRFDGNSIKSGTHCAYDVAKTLNDPSPKTKLFLKEYISYDENLLSSLIGMSTPTYYFSIGSGVLKRNSKGKKMPHIDEGILCGLVGARLPKAGFMENRFTFPRDKYDSLNLKFDTHKSDDFWIKKVYSDAFPEQIIPTYCEIQNKPEIYGSIYIDGVNEVYLEKRLMLSILPFIREAAARGKERIQSVFCGVPPIGGGVWAVGINCLTIHRLIVVGVLKFLDSHFNYDEMQHIKALALPNLDIHFYSSFVPKGNIKEIKINEKDGTATVVFKHPENNKIKIFNRIRYVAEVLPEEFKDCISIAGYAWDGNSYPGNEYWDGGMGSFDPKAIYCSLLGQFQNTDVNLKLADEERIRIY